MEPVVIIGLFAAALTTSSFVPQVIRIVKTRSTKDISLVMYAIFAAGIALWLAYGILIGSLPIILANTVTILLALTILGFKIVYG